MTDGVIIFLITQTIAFIVALFKIYVQVTVKMRELELRIEQNEKKDDVIFKKLDNIAEQIHELYLELSKK
jgi:hypothetical protein